MSFTVLREKFKSERAVITTLNYLEDLANTVGKDISRWNIEDVFGDHSVQDPLLRRLHTSPRTLNKLFFEHSKIIELPKDKTSNLSPEQVTQVQLAIESAFAIRRRDLDSQIESAQYNLTTYAKKMETCTQNLSDLYARRFSFKSNLLEQVNQIISKGYELHNVLKTIQSTHIISFLTQNICMTHKRTDGVEMRVPFGKFKVELDPHHVTLRVKPYGGNIRAPNNYYHTFISKEGSICWGSANTTASRLMAQGDWLTVFEILSNLLVTYPGGTPYAHLDDFYFKGSDEFGNNTWLSEEHRKNLKTDPVAEAPPEDYCQYCDEENGEPHPGHTSLDHENECGDCGGQYTDRDGHQCDEEEAF